MKPESRALLFRTFGSAILVQALLSATNFFVGIFLVRNATNDDYGYYVLFTVTVALLTGLQGSFIQPPLVLRLNRCSPSERADVVGGVYRGQRRFVARFIAVVGILLALLAVSGLFDRRLVTIATAGVLGLAAAVYREFFRMVLFANRRSHDVLKADLAYGVLVLLGVPLATYTPAPAAGAILAIGLAAAVGGRYLSRLLWRYEPWNPSGSPEMLGEMAPLGMWSALGSATHWAFSQGFNYVVAGTLDVAAVAVIAATRLLMMPINLVSTGISSLMMATASAWLDAKGPVMLFRHLLLISSALGAAALCYFAGIWFLHGFIFEHLMHKHFAQGSQLVLAWSAVFLVTLFRDQLNFFPGACGLHRRLMGVTATAALISLGIGYVAIRLLGAIGAPIGVLFGEIFNLIGIVVISLGEIRRRRMRRR